MKMKIVAIEYLGEDEADVIISDGNFSCCAFAHPFNQNLGDAISTPLLPLDVIGLMRARDKDFCIKQYGKIPIPISMILMELF
ncbi:hypothetical protein [Bartonella sp. HY406]|uniref:hypothetical protein n=1 Tax=Bartonella sp. HY406 TaxID=2979331 RepID=UPI0021C7CCCF|nr:hypothetical protein [Bartonella sp. HY406]UXN02706.1 hypothetical protein N6B01_09510 [Bartonella sp. HY406]